MNKNWIDGFCEEIKHIVMKKYKVGHMIEPSLFKTYQQGIILTLTQSKSYLDSLNDNKYWLEDIIDKYKLNKSIIEEEDQTVKVKLNLLNLYKFN